MIYVFRAEDGEEIELPFNMADVPSIGDTVDVDGKAFRRIFCGIIGKGTIAQKSKYPYLSSHMDPTPGSVKGAKTVRTARGKPKVLIESRAHEREVMARNDLVAD